MERLKGKKKKKRGGRRKIGKAIKEKNEENVEGTIQVNGGGDGRRGNE